MSGAFDIKATSLLGMLGPGVQIATARLACERQGVPVPVPGGSLLQYTCATALRAGWTMDRQMPSEQTGAAAGVSRPRRGGCRVLWHCAVEPEDCGQWTVKRVVCPAPSSARTLPPARLQPAVVKTALPPLLRQGAAGLLESSFQMLAVVARRRSHRRTQRTAERPDWQTALGGGSCVRSRVLPSTAGVRVRSAAPRPLALTLHNRQVQDRSPRHPHGSSLRLATSANYFGLVLLNCVDRLCAPR